LTPQAFLDAFPNRQRSNQLFFSGWGQTQPSLATVFAAAFRNPSVLLHDFQSPRQRSAVHRENFPESTLGYLSSIFEGLQDAELRTSQTKGPKLFLVDLAQSAGGPAIATAQAGEFW
jgi:hypothetical protein